MIRSRAQAAGLVVLFGVLLAGCGAQSGQAVPAPPSVAASSKPSVTAGLAARPREVSLDGLDPCALLTPEQRAAFGLDNEPYSGTEPAEGNARTCSFSSNEVGNGVRFIASTATGVGVWFDGTRLGEVLPIVVAGFPAVQIRFPDLEMCAVAVDVADGQQLIAQHSGTYQDPQPTVEEQCAEAATLSQAAMQTLLAR